MYRKRFDAPPGAEVADHLGGYLPFSAVVSSLLRSRGNTLAVRRLNPLADGKMSYRPSRSDVALSKEAIWRESSCSRSLLAASTTSTW